MFNLFMMWGAQNMNKNACSGSITFFAITLSTNWGNQLTWHWYVGHVVWCYSFNQYLLDSQISFYNMSHLHTACLWFVFLTIIYTWHRFVSIDDLLLKLIQMWSLSLYPSITFFNWLWKWDGQTDIISHKSWTETVKTDQTIFALIISTSPPKYLLDVGS